MPADDLHDALLGVVVSATVGSRPAPLDATGHPAWPEAFDRLARRGLAPAMLRAHDLDALTIGPGQVAQLRSAALGTASRLLSRDAAAAAVLGGLGHVEDDLVLLKGPAFARFYPDPALRGYTDVDLLVLRGSFRSVLDRLSGLGYEPAVSGLRSSWIERFGKGRTLRGPGPVLVDLHRTLAPGPFGLRIEVAALVDHRQRFQVGRHACWVLDAEASFVHACIHAALNRVPTPTPLCDVAVIARQQLDLGSVDELARGWRAQELVRGAVDATARLTGAPTPLDDWAGGLPRDPEVARLVSRYRNDHPSPLGEAWVTVASVPGLVDRARYVAGFLVPPKGFVAERGGVRSVLGRSMKRQPAAARGRAIVDGHDHSHIAPEHRPAEP